MVQYQHIESSSENNDNNLDADNNLSPNKENQMNNFQDTKGLSSKSMKYSESESEKKKYFLKKFYAMAIGNIMEWFDFSTFGALADILGENFFPETDSRLIQLLEAMGVFGAAFLMRPLGGVILGRVGDTIGRKKALELSILLMLLPSFLIGCLPTYKQINWVAPVMLVLLRLLQGLAAGGEMVGAFLFTLEATEGKNTGFWGGSCKASGNFGTTLGMGLVTVLRLLCTRDQLVSWGWRIPFWISIIFGIIGIFARRNIKNGDHDNLNPNAIKKPLNHLFKNYFMEIILIIFIVGLWGCLYYTCFIWMAYFLQEPSLIGENSEIKSYAWAINFFANLLLVFLLPLGGHIGDKIIKKNNNNVLLGHQTTLIYAVMLALILVIPAFLLILSRKIPFIIIGYLFMAIPISIYGANIPGLIILLFNVNLRYTGVGIAYNLAGAIFSSTASIIQTSLVMSGKDDNNSTDFQGVDLILDSRLRPAFYIILICFFSFYSLSYGVDYCVEKKRKLPSFSQDQELVEMSQNKSREVFSIMHKDQKIDPLSTHSSFELMDSKKFSV